MRTECAHLDGRFGRGIVEQALERAHHVPLGALRDPLGVEAEAELAVFFGDYRGKAFKASPASSTKLTTG